jgi:hypothetical protein
LRFGGLYVNFRDDPCNNHLALIQTLYFPLF